MPEGHARGEILVVDDEPTIGEVVSRYLERAGYATRVAADGDRAIELHGERAADLIVLDLMLPGVDGLEVMRRIRKDRTRRPAIVSDRRRPARAIRERAVYHPCRARLAPTAGARRPVPRRA